MMENNWKAWIPHHELENKYFICKAVDDEDGLQLFLISNDYTQKYVSSFQVWYMLIEIGLNLQHFAR